MCREAATLAINHIRENIQTIMDDEAWARHLYILRTHLVTMIAVSRSIRILADVWPQRKEKRPVTSLCDACKKPLDMERRIWTDGMFYMHLECVKSTPTDDIVGLSKALVREARSSASAAL